MEKMVTRESTDLEKWIINYYNECWLSRFRQGHNPKSLAMHMGFFENGTQDNDRAKMNMNAFIARQLALPPDSNCTILDAGCGIGGTCFYIGKNFPHSHLTGVNLSNEQVAFARQHCADMQLQDRITFLVEDFATTSLTDSTFDFIYTVESLCHAKDKLAFYEEAHRLLKPGGKLLILDYMYANQPKDDYQEQLLQDFKNGWAVEEYLTNPLQGLRKAGFTAIQANTLTSYVSPGIEWSAKRAGKKLQDQNGSDYSELMINHLQACVALHQLISNNMIDYRMIMCKKP